ncbi:trigger factor [Adlercreutzia sp. R21]|uniref:Trigger factor n=1 Tax=Adlercreutzia wanghongyangiae TaxID=3111451 RepID=A0ABU6IHS9_9ACTN|nr:trigger factor [Adlercreutzia sp. R21]MEC4176003.1 trigger factor [Adlercreutzia sp. R7]MEC4183749.1 trigger factor [Adlercreutzia sp. R21]
METKVEALEGNKAKVTVTIDAADIDGRINKTYKDFARKYNFPGFRKGKAPRPVIDNALGAEAVLATVTDEVINSAYPAAIEAEKLAPMGAPAMEENELVCAGKPYTVTFTVELRPAAELSNYDAVAIEIPFADATEAEIEDQMNAMAEHYTTYEDASAATKMKPENFADLTIKATDADGNDIAAITSESRLYGPGTGMLSEAFDAEIMGMKKGQTKEFTLEVPADETAVLLADQAGKPVAFEVTCNVVKKKAAPEITDEWAKETMGFESVDDMREQIKQSLSMQKASMMPRIKENAIMAQLLERFEGDAPEALVNEAETSLLQDFFTQMQRAGMTFDAYLASQDITADQFKADLKAQSADHVKEELALEAWARHAGMEVTDEDISAEFAKTGVEDPAALEQEWRDAGRLHLIRTGLLRQKAIEDLMENASVTEVDFAAQAAAEKKAAKKPAKKKAAKKADAEPAAEEAAE